MASIPVTKENAKALMSLPRNEAGFAALLDTLKAEYTAQHDAYQRAAHATVLNPDARNAALTCLGQCRAIEAVVDLLERQLMTK